MRSRSQLRGSAVASVLASASPARGAGIPVALGLIAVAWLLAILAELTGKAVLLHHHTLIEGGPPLPVALFLFLLGWQVMVAAMMLPASLPAVHRLDGRVRSVAQSAGRPAFGPPLGFLLGYAALWTIYGVGAFGFDVGLHRLTDAVPWLAARPWLIESTAVLAAGAYQFAPMKRRALEACRHPFEGHTHEADGTAPALALGVRHGYDCVIASWALMLLMFSAGFANVWWMLALAVLMALETFGHPVAAIVRAIGVLLFVFAGLILFSGWIPAFAT